MLSNFQRNSFELIQRKTGIWSFKQNFNTFDKAYNLERLLVFQIAVRRYSADARRVITLNITLGLSDRFSLNRKPLGDAEGVRSNSFCLGKIVWVWKRFRDFLRARSVLTNLNLICVYYLLKWNALMIRFSCTLY